MSHQYFAMVPSRAVKDRELGHAAFRLLCLLATYRNSKHGWSHPTLRTLASELGLSESSGESQISRAVKELRDKGYINHMQGNGRSVSRYQVILDEKDPGEINEEDNNPALSENNKADLLPENQSELFENDKQRRLLKKTKEPDRSATRGCRLTEDWRPQKVDWDYCLSLGLDGHKVCDRFRDFWIAQPGQKGVKLNWNSTFRNWCRTAKERGQDMRPPVKSL